MTQPPLAKYWQDPMCAICCDTFVNPMMGDCGHVFCNVCIMRWLQMQPACPICKHVTPFWKLETTLRRCAAEAESQRDLDTDDIDRAHAQYRKALVDADDGKLDDAADALERSVSIYQSNVQFRSHLIHCLSKLAHIRFLLKHYQESVRCCEYALQLVSRPRHSITWDLYEALGAALYELDEYGRSCQMLEQSVLLGTHFAARSSTNRQLHHMGCWRLAIALEMRGAQERSHGDHAAALKTFNRALNYCQLIREGPEPFIFGRHATTTEAEWSMLKVTLEEQIQGL